MAQEECHGGGCFAAGGEKRRRKRSGGNVGGRVFVEDGSAERKQRQHKCNSG